MVPKIGSRRSDGPISRFRFCGENVGRSFVVIRFSELTKNLQFGAETITAASFIFQEEYRMKIEYILFPSVFFKITDPCVEGHFQRVHTIRFSEPTKFRILENGSCERALTFTKY